MRPAFSRALLAIAASLPGAAAVAQHHAGHVAIGPAMHHPGVMGPVRVGEVVTAPVSAGGGGVVVNQTTVNNTTIDESRSYSDGGYGNGGYGYGGYGYNRYGYGGYGYGGYGYGGLGYGTLGYGGVGYYGVLPSAYYGLPYSPLVGFVPTVAVAPAGAMFGPRPIQQMLGGAQPMAAGGAVGGAPGGAGMAPDDASAPRTRKVRVSNAQARAELAS